MKRDMELIRTIMLKIEESQQKVQKVTCDGVPQEIVNYNIMLMIDGGLLEGSYKPLKNGSMSTPLIHIEKLTWEGHEFLDNLRKDQIWEKIKNDFKESSMETIKQVSKDLALGFAKKQTQELLKLSSD